MIDNPSGEIDGGLDPEVDQEFDARKLLAEESFLGQYPFEELLNRLTSQFRNYMSSEDTEHYVDIFYSQLDNSLDSALQATMFDPDEVREHLENLRDKFVDHLIKLFELYLNLGIEGYDDGSLDDETGRYILTRAYEYFILAARRNFKVAISASVTNRLIREAVTEDKVMIRVSEMIRYDYDPIVTAMTPIEFLKLTGDNEVLKLFETHRLVGNFLVKYTPRLYRHETYMIEVINHITNTWWLTRSMIDGQTPDYQPPTSETEVNDHGVQSEPTERQDHDNDSHQDSLQPGNLQPDDQVLQHQPEPSADAIRREGPAES